MSSATVPAHEGWFQKECGMRRPWWDAAIAEERDTNPTRSEEEVARYLADGAEKDLAGLNAEIASMLVRTGYILAAATLLVAAYTFKPNARGAEGALTLALCLTAVSFVVALVPMRPPFMRALRDAYMPRHKWTLLPTNDFRRWVVNCYLCDRRTPVITMYKRAHAVAIPVLIVATGIAVYGLAVAAHK